MPSVTKQNKNIIVFHLLRRLSKIEGLTFNDETEKWEKVGTVQNPRWAFCSSEINGKIYLVGGCKLNGDFLSSVDVVDRRFQTTEASPMNRGRYSFGMCQFYSRHLLVAGGMTERGKSPKSSSCEIYDSFTDKWENTSDMIHDRAYFPLVYFDDKILAIGGRNVRGEISSTIESFDVKSRKWELWSTELLEKRHDHGAVAFDNKFYVFGGFGESNKISSTIEMYSLETGQFTYVKPMPMSLCIIRLDFKISK